MTSRTLGIVLAPFNRLGYKPRPTRLGSAKTEAGMSTAVEPSGFGSLDE
jgi:hypothetical protein